MAIEQPVSPLWSAVTKIYNPWPLDDEGVAAEVATAWRGGGKVLAEGAKETGRAGDASLSAWPDPVGVDYGGQVAAVASHGAELERNLHARAAHADYYGAQLTSAKSSIVDTVARNEELFARLGNPLLGVAGPALQTGFAALVAGSMHGMITQKAGEIAGYPVDPDPPSPKPGPYPIAPGAKQSRGLSPQEYIEVKKVFGDSINLRDVVLTDDGVLSARGDNAVTVNNTIYFPVGTLSGNTDTPEFHAWLVHELTHVWQYQNGKGIADLIPAAWNEDYAYGGSAGLNAAVAAGKPFGEFSTEQQAEIAAQYYYGRETGRDWRGLPGPYDPAPYKHYIDMVFPKK
ncbi:DUF4157 domain-containing protein [Actinoplanes sp. NPDC051470]|uniref:WXG100-like domain-containing protein n=1 Tax=unclassified Actinoplanes TaxID=2626549 RepID=UPI00342C5C02